MRLQRLKQLQTIPQGAAYHSVPSPVGELTILATDEGIYNILWQRERQTDECERLLMRFSQRKNHAVIVEANRQLDQYFNQQRTRFALPLQVRGTSFQQLAWLALCQIPYGKTISYAEQATIMGNKNKARAVGLANGMNPMSIIVPCHRVIGNNGSLTGFGGGLDAKRILLRLENAIGE